MPPSEPERMAMAHERREAIGRALAQLSYRERKVVRLRYGIGDGYTYTLEEVGRIFNVTRERIRQIEARALRRLAQMHQLSVHTGPDAGPPTQYVPGMPARPTSWERGPAVYAHQGSHPRLGWLEVADVAALRDVGLTYRRISEMLGMPQKRAEHALMLARRLASG